MKHNKKRNTAFLYEALIQELTKSVVEKNAEKKQIIVSILKEHFSKGKILHAELSVYKTINEAKNLDRKLAEKLFSESRIDYDSLPKEMIFSDQTRLINKINKKLGTNVFSNFVPNYKNLASVFQIFNNTVPAKQRVLLEQNLIDSMCGQEQIKEQMKPVDNLVYKTFVKKFNEKYGNSLLNEQKDLLTNYLVSFSDNGLSLKIFLNEELARIKGEIEKCKQLREIKEDTQMISKTNKILEKLELFKEKEFDQQMLSELLKIQNFVKEALADG